MPHNGYTGETPDLSAADLIDYRTPDGTPVVLVTPPIPDDATPELREALARRRIALTEHRCPCGGRPVHPSRQQRRAAQRAGIIAQVRVDHVAGCPAPRAGALLADWSEASR